jgi:hypothetical protein
VPVSGGWSVPVRLRKKMDCNDTKGNRSRGRAGSYGPTPGVSLSSLNGFRSQDDSGRQDSLLTERLSTD